MVIGGGVTGIVQVLHARQKAVEAGVQGGVKWWVRAPNLLAADKTD